MNRSWKDALQKKLSQLLSKKYENAFPSHYYEDCTLEDALSDIKLIEKLSLDNPIDIQFYLSTDNSLHLRLFQFDNRIPLSDILPMLENMDLRTLDERPYKISLASSSVWISDFTVAYKHGTLADIEKIKKTFQEAFIQVHLGYSENDGFNKLVLGAKLAWDEIVILRAYAKYLRQTGIRFSQAYIEQALTNNPGIASELTRLFHLKFDPNKNAKSKLEEREAAILQTLESVVSLDEDSIIRCLLNLIKATLRTNYFKTEADGKAKSYLSFKLSSKEVPGLPLPLPLYEIFVYSPRFEGIHLRSAKVARGGIRWSDRREDFRTEILGLMKAQTVKNAVIVPSGAKGGFVLKTSLLNPSRDIIQKEVVTCYTYFISGLLDLTDNLKDGKVIRPPQVVCYDDQDTYLVVAADKGTASFSDTANAIAKSYGFWLGDAFASGGSAGYDHKKMGITARGAWESVKRHFYELNISIDDIDFSVVGIGDMSGDVFGNGMMRSPHVKLLAAFDHRHIFLDPDPDAKNSLKERVRLFNLPTSSWEDYNPKLISAGGGVYKRSSKTIVLSAEIKKALGIQDNSLAPNELIRAILKAPVDLLWNGGIGTYVKASTETHADVGDKTNEFCRINGNELRCRIVGEGGNLGFTQLARVEYALQGGLINTDFIDNSAGVDCSDHEVNIKILLNQEVAKKRLTEKKRNELLVKMTKEVADLVLADNFDQALVLSYANFYAVKQIGIHQDYIKSLEASGELNRAVEFLPDDKRLLERKAAGLGLTRPELAVLLAYTKIHIKNEILASDIPEHPYLKKILETSFPTLLQKSYGKALEKHSLSREIIATQLSNQIINETNITFVFNIQNETGATVAEIIRAYTIASRVFGTHELQQLIESFNYKIPMATQCELLSYIRRLAYLSTRWFLRHGNSKTENMQTVITHFAKGAKILETLIPTLMGGSTKAYLETLTAEFVKAGISKEVASRIATIRAMYSSLNVIEVATQNRFDLNKTATLYFAVGEYFNLLWFRDRIAEDTREGHWNTLARLTLRDELDILQRNITVAVMRHNKANSQIHLFIERWIEENHRAIERWEKILEMLHSSTSIDYVMFFIALKELSNLIQTSETA